MKLFLVAFLLVFISKSPAFAQDKINIDYGKLYQSVLKEYGFDQVLVNGYFYEDKYRKKFGHQFFLEDQLYTGTLVFRGNVYKGVEMKYDIFDQQLVLYISQDNRGTWIVPPNDFVSDFSFEGKAFAKYNFQDEPKFFQVVFDAGKLKYLDYWFKKKSDSKEISSSGYVIFSESEKRSYLMIEGEIVNFKSDKSFAGLFPEGLRTRIKQYMKINHIKAAKSNESEIVKLLTYCNSLL